MWDLIVSVPDHCLSFYFVRLLQVSQHFACVIRYQVLYNITYVATYVTLTTFYRT